MRTICAAVKGMMMTCPRRRNIAMLSTCTLCPAASDMTNGTVRGARSDVATVTTSAVFFSPPASSARRGAVMPAGMAARMRKDRASVGENGAVAVYMARGRTNRVNIAASPTVRISFAARRTDAMSIVSELRKKIPMSAASDI